MNKDLPTPTHPAKRLFRCLLLVLSVTVTSPGMAMAVSYSLSGTALHNTFMGGTYPAYEVSGMLNLGDPTLINMGPESWADGADRYKVAYSIDYTFLIGGTTLTGSGAMVIDAHGCGLFDCNFAVALSNNYGDQYQWESGDGGFFNTAGLSYPDSTSHSLTYAQAPERIQFYSTGLYQRTGSLETGGHYYLRDSLVANRTEGVPEPSTLFLFGIGLAGLAVYSRGPR